MIKSRLTPAVLTFILLASLAFFITPYMLVASGAYFLMVWGVVYRGRRSQHVFLMTSAILIDLGLVLVLQIQREAVQTAASLSLEFWQLMHVASSSLATLLYFPILFLGWRLYLLGPSQSFRYWHIRLGWAAFAFRTIGFVLMFSLLSRPQ